MTSCKHAIPLPQHPDGSVVDCAIGVATLPSRRFCAGCDHYEGPSRGLGDTVHRAAKATGTDRLAAKASALLGAKGCGCAERRRRLNAALPYGGSDAHQ